MGQLTSLSQTPWLDYRNLVLRGRERRGGNVSYVTAWDG